MSITETILRRPIKLGWRPSESLLIRGTWGTAFRAPNLRELFLSGSTGFLNVSDPCYLPEEALNNLTGNTSPRMTNEIPDFVKLQSHWRGSDKGANNGGFNTFSVEAEAGGALDLDPEESESWTVGFAYEQNFTNQI